MRDRYEIAPDGDGWNWRKGDESGAGYADRGAAIEAARDARGDKRTPLFFEDGSKAGVVVEHRGPEAMVILRADGSVYGELDHELVEGGAPQFKDISPAVQHSEVSG